MRFSKKYMTDLLIERIASLERRHNFNPSNGWDQVKSKPMEVVVDYGAYDALQDLLNEIDPQ